MTFVAVPIAVRQKLDVEDALNRATRAVAEGAALIEWRVDALADEIEPAESIITLVRESPAPCILTCRPNWEGGEFTGDDAKRLHLVEKVMESGHRPRYVDLELAAFQRSPDDWLAALGAGEPPEDEESDTSVILSTHDFDRRPRDLLQRIEAMTEVAECKVIKIAWRARSLRDNLEAFDLLAERRKPTIALCMGRFGLMSRILAPKFGGFVTFAALDRGEATDVGQPTIDELNNVYPYDHLTKQTQLYGLIGWPVEHSYGPIIHNAGFRHVDHDGVYLPLPVPGGPEEYEHFKATVGELVDHQRLHFRGASVTMPHKENLLRFVDERGGRTDALTRLVGAANTLVLGAAGGLACTNTDCPAIVELLSEALNVEPDGLADTRVAILGAGGVARAAIAGLIQHGAKVTIYNRTRKRAEALAKDLRNRAASIEATGTISIGTAEKVAGRRYDVYINCTSVGMTGGPAPDQTPFQALGSEDIRLNDAATVFDTVYHPARTPLITEAETRGARVILGIDLFIRQAAKQFEAWTGEYAPIDRWHELLKRRISVEA